MGYAQACLGWRPAEFWQSTPVEFWTAVKGWERFNRKPEGGANG